MIAATLNTPVVIDGYVRLSRDDNKRNYSSIENQKLIIQKYALLRLYRQMLLKMTHEAGFLAG